MIQDRFVAQVQLRIVDTLGSEDQALSAVWSDLAGVDWLAGAEVDADELVSYSYRLVRRELTSIAQELSCALLCMRHQQPQLPF